MITSRPPTAVTIFLPLTPGGFERGANRVGDDARVHDLAFDDRVGEQRRDGDLGRARVRRGRDR